MASKPKAIRDVLHVDAGDQVLTDRGDVVVRGVSTDVRNLRGLFKRSRRRRPVTIEEMDEAILRVHSRKR